MANIVVYDPADVTVANRVTGYFPSAHTPDYSGESDKLTNPDLSALTGVQVFHWKRSGSTVIEMTTQEKADMDATIPVQTESDIKYGSSMLSTTSTSHIIATGMVLTPSSGIYKVEWIASVFNTSNRDDIYLQVYVDGVAQGVEMRYKRGGGNIGVVTAFARVAVNGSQVIEGRWRQAGGTGQMYGRTLALLRVTN